MIDHTEFIQFALSHGLIIKELYPSQKIRRCPTLEKPKSLNGAYLFDGEKGWVTDWGKNSKPAWFKSNQARVYSDEERRQWALKREAERQVLEKQYADKAHEAAQIIRMARLDTHPYLAGKGFPDEKGLVLNGRLIIPMCNVLNNQIQGYQEVRWDSQNKEYTKKMMYGAKAKDGVFCMGNHPNDHYWLVEGYATGLSVKRALNALGLDDTVVVCFSAHNILNVAPRLNGERYVFADNDASQTGEKTAKKTGLPWVMSDTVGFDANDLHNQYGLSAVIEKIENVRSERFFEQSRFANLKY